MISVRMILPESVISKKKREKATKAPKTPKASESTSNPMDLYEGIFGDIFAKLGTVSKVESEPLKPEDYVGEYEWSFKDKNPFIYGKTGCNPWEELVNAQTIVVRANGPELELIRSHFQNIPWVINRRGICEWTGEFAKFIALNFDFKP